MLQDPSKMIHADLRGARRAQWVSGSRWWHSFWLWVSVAITVLVLALATRSAAAQTERGNELIERTLALQPDMRHGSVLYQEFCASCHGKQAHGSPDPVTPSLAGQQQLYLIKQLVDFSEGDRTEPEMHRVVALKQLSAPQAIRDVSSYLHGLPGNSRPEAGDGKNLATGKRYYDGLCAYCHGPQGEGNEKHATPSLQRQHYSYLLMQTRRLAIGHRYSVPIEVIEVLEKLPFDTLTAISDYASRLPEQASMGPAAERKHQVQVIRLADLQFPLLRMSCARAAGCAGAQSTGKTCRAAPAADGHAHKCR